MPRDILIFDTTLRDGEQSPGCSMNLGEKLELARQLAALGVDVIEAGFPVSSPGDFAAVREIARTVRGPAIAGLCRALERDIDTGWEALREAERPRIHTFIATSPIHMEYKLKMKPDEVLAQAVAMVRRARNLCADVEFSAEDAVRSDPEFLYRILEAVIGAGASTVNIPDTVGYALPMEYSALIAGIRNKVPNIDKAVISTHCHNDLGLATANSLAAVAAGAGQVECTINGIGERAGNAALEEIVMAIHTRPAFLDARCKVNTAQIYASSRLLTSITGVKVQPNKAVVGENAFAHEAGIHQHGVLENRATYEIMTPESIGLPRNVMVLGKHSGRHAFEERLLQLGLKVAQADIAALFDEFKKLADKKKTVSDRDIEALVMGRAVQAPEKYRLERFVINSGNSITATSAVRLSISGDGQNEVVAVGDGPIDASFKAIDKIVGKKIVLEDFALEAVTSGKDAQGEARVRIALDGRKYNGRGLSTDIVEASVRAYLAAINSTAVEQGAADGAHTGP